MRILAAVLAALAAILIAAPLHAQDTGPKQAAGDHAMGNPKAPVTIIAHSLGGSIALLYSGIFPETVKKVVVVKGRLVSIVVQ